GGIRAAGRATPFLYVHAAREPDQLALQRPAGGTGRAPPGHRARGARRAAAARHAEGPAPGTAQAGLFPRPRAAAGDREPLPDVSPPGPCPDPPSVVPV